MKLPVVTADPAKFILATRVATRHMVASLILFDGRFTLFPKLESEMKDSQHEATPNLIIHSYLWTRSGIRLQPKSLCNVVEVRIRFTFTLNILDLLFHNGLPLFKSLARYWPMNLRASALETKTMSSLWLFEAFCIKVVWITYALVSWETVASILMYSCAYCTNDRDKIVIKARFVHV